MNTSYQPGPSGEQPGYWPPQPPKKRKIWPWIVGAVVLFAACAFGGIALLGAGANKVVNDVHATEQAQLNDIKINSCTMGAGGLATVKYTIHNDTGSKQTYTPTFDITDAKGNVYGQAADIVTDLPAGKDYHGSAMGTYGDASVGNIICKLTGA